MDRLGWLPVQWFYQIWLPCDWKDWLILCCGVLRYGQLVTGRTDSVSWCFRLEQFPGLHRLCGRHGMRPERPDLPAASLCTRVLLPQWCHDYHTNTRSVSGQGYTGSRQRVFWSLLYSANSLLTSRLVALLLHVILNEWPSFYSTFWMFIEVLYLQCYLVTWLVLRKTAA